MNATTRLILVGAGAVGALGILALVANRAYFAPRAALLERLETARSGLRGYEATLKGRPAIESELKAIAGRTLGVQQDQVEHLFRSALNDIAVECGLADVVVSNGPMQVDPNPAGLTRLKYGLSKALKAQRDFLVLPGELSGVGSLEQVLKAVAVVKAQPWVFRVDRFSIKPVGAERTRFELSLGVATLMLPDLAPKDAPALTRVALDASAAESWRAIVERNVFKAPEPRVAVRNPPETDPRTQDPNPPAPPAPSPYTEWRLVGVLESPRQGVQAWLVNTRNGQTLELTTGEPVLDAVFIEGAGERAVFKIGEVGFELHVGQTLAERRPIG